MQDLVRNVYLGGRVEGLALELLPQLVEAMLDRFLGLRRQNTPR
jgi:hypothetical protein